MYREVASGRGAFLDCRHARTRTSPSISRPCSPLAAQRASTRRASRSRSRRRRITTWAASLPTRNGRTTRRRAVGLRRGRLDRRAWREPAGLQFAARGRGVRRAGGARHRRVPAAATTRSSRARIATPAARRRPKRQGRSTSSGSTMTADVGVIRDAGSLANALLHDRALERERAATGALATCCRPPN